MELTNPIALWGLSALAIPVAIHLLSLKEGQVIRIGSLRHLTETNSRQFRGIRLNEYLLLLLRMLLILWLVFFISGLHSNTSTLQKTKWVVLEKGLENDKDFMPLIDSLQRDHYEAHYLAKNFPLVSTGAAYPPNNYWMLIEELKERSLYDVVIIASNRMNSFRGQRIPLPDNMRWIAKPTTSHEFIVSARQTSKDSVWVRTGKSDAEGTFFETLYKSPNQIQAIHSDTLSVIIANTSKFERDGQIMRAALRTLDVSLPHHFHIKTIRTEQFNEKDTADWLIWLSDESYPAAWNGNAIYLHRMSVKTILTQSTDKLWMLTHELNEEVAVKENLTMALAAILFPSPQENKKAAEEDKRMFPEEWLNSYDDAGSVPEKIIGHNTHWDQLWFVFILVTLVTERIVAFKRNQ
ncbi:MAG: BatA domain-containing protein [Cyclobacteriaceae bacterium]|nr:BatA domain-containing protein [Cyclobacteriaceae bacterium]